MVKMQLRFILAISLVLQSACAKNTEEKPSGPINTATVVSSKSNTDQGGLEYKTISPFRAKIGGNDVKVCFEENADPTVAANKPETAIVYGNTEVDETNGRDFAGVIQKKIANLLARAIFGGSRVCIYRLLPDNWLDLTKNTALNSFFFIGHGANGNIADPLNDTAISPDDAPVFEATGVRALYFLSCEAGKKQTQWEKIFQKSTAVRKDSYQTFFRTFSIPVNLSLDMLGVFPYSEYVLGLSKKESEELDNRIDKKLNGYLDLSKYLLP